jgi:prepilin-type processing-associated H-X9-DG protein
MLNTEVYKSPLLEEDEKARMNKPFVHTVNTDGSVNGNTVYFGGYGYNFQYLGNARDLNASIPTWHNNEARIKTPASMVAIGDTRGSKKGVEANPYGVGGAAVYVIDPPIGSQSLGSGGSRKAAGWQPYYEGGTDGDENFRSMPGDRNHKNLINYTFADGHSESVTREKIDDISDANPQGTNAWWNGQFDRIRR